MNPTIHVKNLRLTNRLEQYVGKKTGRLDRYMPNMAELRVDLSSQKARNSTERKIAQLTVRDDRGTILRAEEQNSDIYAAIDMVVDKLYRQIKRYRGKATHTRRRLNRKVATAANTMTLIEAEPLPLEDEMDDLEAGTLVRSKKFALQPMSAEEAVDQMELLGHDFYMFFNIEEESINVVYRRRDNDYGLLQPELE